MKNTKPMDAEHWAELYRLREAVKGPEGFATWQDAATHERMLRVKAESSPILPQQGGEQTPTDAEIMAVARIHFKPDAKEDSEETIKAFLECTRDIVAKLYPLRAAVLPQVGEGIAPQATNEVLRLVINYGCALIADREDDAANIFDKISALLATLECELDKLVAPAGLGGAKAVAPTDLTERQQAVMLHDFPKLSNFFHKHALGPMLAPSCLVCGCLPLTVAIQHGELPGIVVCASCRDKAAAPVAEALPVAAEKDAQRLDWLENDMKQANPVSIVYENGWFNFLSPFPGISTLVEYGNKSLRGALDKAIEGTQGEKV